MPLTSKQIAVMQATTPAQIEAVRVLLREYREWIATTLGEQHACHTSFDHEIANAAAVYSPPRGFLLLATGADGTPVGCIAVHEIAGNRAEIKRLWVRPETRGLHAGAALLDAALQHASQLGYAEAVLDTVPEAMPHALALYRSRGFTETSRFNDNPVDGVNFYRLKFSQGTP